MQISSNIVNGPKSNSIDFGTNVGCRLIQKPSHNFLLTFRSLRMFKIVFRDSSLYPKQLPLFCLLWLINASADRTGYITNFCSMIELLHELKISSC